MLCECGCGAEVKPGRRFVSGHNSRVNNPSSNPEVAAKISAALTGKSRPDITGDNNPMRRPEIAKKCGDANRGKSSLSKGVPISEATKQKISEATTGKKKPMMRGDNNPSKRLDVRMKISTALIGKSHSKQHTQHHSASLQGIPYDEWDGFATNDWRDWNDVYFINEPFVGCHRHHITEHMAVCIPADLHTQTSHNLTTGRGMNEINQLAMEYLHNVQPIVNTDTKR